ncbi:MAG: polyphosphate kinase 1 [Phycisphaeraceae bacterium]
MPESSSPGEFLNRELTWLQFNWRVLHEALDARTPLLERVRFLAIFTSNLDEYFQKRVGGLKRQIAAGVMTRSIDGLTPREQMDAIRRQVLAMQKLQADCFAQEILPGLAQRGIHLLSWSQLTEQDHELARRYFRDNLFAVLTPLAVDPGHPFPFISNLSTSLGVMLRHPAHAREPLPAGDAVAAAIGDGVLQFARVKVPTMLPQWVRLGAEMRFVRLWELIHHHLQDLFEGMVLDQVAPFRITRNADVERDEEDAEDLLELIEQELRDRRFARAVRLEVLGDDARNQPMTRYLIEQLELEESDVYAMPAELDYTALNAIADLNIAELKHEPWPPVIPPRLRDDEADLFSVIRQGDVLVHHPYESFKASVERFISAAASDKKVIAIKLTLYRTSMDSPFMPQLIRAAESGKQVVALVELKARFDEERNISIAQELEKAGVHVVYGIVGLKTHTKTAMVVRHEAEGMRVYAHIGTGNYNSKTAALYTDLGLFTCRPEITGDLVEMFHYLTGRSLKRDFAHLLIAPINMRKRFVDMIDREIEIARAWQQRGGDLADPQRPLIIAKMNSLEDMAIIRKLYEASNAGVTIKLIVRGFCCLRPGVPGMSQNISVMSVIGRFLEHSRIYYFHNAGQSEVYIGSADWMYRNLYHRVECITPILDPTLRQQCRQILDVMLADQRQAWDMDADGQYTQRQPDPDQAEAQIGTHRRLMEMIRGS